MGGGDVFHFQPDAMEAIRTAEEEHRHSGERSAYNLRREGAEHRVGEKIR